MRLTIDSDKRILILEDQKGRHELDLYGAEAFQLISDVWLKTNNPSTPRESLTICTNHQNRGRSTLSALMPRGFATPPS